MFPADGHAFFLSLRGLVEDFLRWDNRTEMIHVFQDPGIRSEASDYVNCRLADGKTLANLAHNMVGCEHGNTYQHSPY